MLVVVMAALTVMAVVAGSLALRVDALRGQARDMLGYAEARLLVDSARAEALYWLASRPIGLASSGFIDEVALVLDGRPYRTMGGATVRVQDERGLLSLNQPDREALLQLLVHSGAELADAQAMLDILEDYSDSDNLRRLQGAEAPDYQAIGLPPPRNDWLQSVYELERMPVWQRLPQVRERVQPWLGVRRSRLFNPNTAPIDLLRATFPRVTPDQWTLFETLRERAPFGGAQAAAAATGIQFVGDQYLFHASNTLRLQVWAPGLPQVLEYNLLILPTGAYAPWRIHEVRLASRPAGPAVSSDAQRLVANFPTPSQTVVITRAASQPTP